MNKIPWWEITPQDVYVNRRKFMVGTGSAAGALALAACAPAGTTSAPTAPAEAAAPAAPLPSSADLPGALGYAEPYASAAVDELGDPLNPYSDVTNYNNYYEFTTDKEDVAKLSPRLHHPAVDGRGGGPGGQSQGL